MEEPSNNHRHRVDQRGSQMRRDQRKSLDTETSDLSEETEVSSGGGNAAQSWRPTKPVGAVEFCAGQEDQVAVLRSWGVPVWQVQARLFNPHYLSAATRTILEGVEARHKYVQKAAKAVIICDPRENEIDLFIGHLGDVGKRGKKREASLKDHVVGLRFALRGVDRAELRGILSIPDRILPLQPKCYVFNDNAYWHTPASLFGQYLHKEFVQHGAEAVYALVSLFDFRGKGECLFLHRYQLPACPKRTEVVWGRESDNRLTSREISVPATAEIDYLEGYAWKDEGGNITFHGASSRFGGETRYDHTWSADAFFEHSVYLFQFDGQEYKATMHIETRVGYKTLVNVCYTRANPGDSMVVNHAVPKVAFIEDGFIPQLHMELRPKAQTTDPKVVASVRTFYRDADAIFKRLLPMALQRNLCLWAKTLDTAKLNTATRALYELQPNMLPPQDFEGMNVRMAVMRTRALELQEQTGISIEFAEPIVALQLDQTRVGLAVELFRILKNVSSFLANKVLDFFDYLKRCAKHAWAPDVELDMARLIRRLFSKLPVLYTAIKRVESVVASWSWLNNMRSKMIDLCREHPILFNVFSVVANSASLLFRAYLEESAKRMSAPVFLVWSLMESLLDFVDWYFTNSCDRVSIVIFVRNVFLRILAHAILTIIPFPAAVILHALWNWNVSRHKNGFLQDLIEAVRSVDAQGEWDLAPVDNYQLEIVDVPDTLLVKEGEKYVPLRERPEYFDVARRTVVKSKKTHLLKCFATQHFQRPSGDLLSIALMVINRLDKPIFERPERGSVQSGYSVAWRLFLRDRVEQVEPYSLDEFITYIEGQGFSASKVALYKERVRANDSIAGPRGKMQEMVGKTDEILPISDKLASGPTTKMRPIFPIDECDIDFMRWLLPFKQRFGFPFETHISGRLFTFTYMLNTRADFLDEWINTRCYQDGIHVIALGDDNYTLYVDSLKGIEGADALCAAFDLTMCDRTCGEDVQGCFLSYLTDCGLSHFEKVRFWNSCSGMRKVMPAGYKKKDPTSIEIEPEFYYHQKKKSTLTGNPATSLQAVFAQLCFTPRAVEDWLLERSIAPDPERLGQFIHESGTRNGHILEWETRSLKGTRYFDRLHLRTFLGGRFIPDRRDGHIKWCPDNILKSGMIAPDTAQIYRGANHVMQHLAAVSQDQGLLRTPIGRAICERYRALATQSGLEKEDFQEAVEALTASKSWYQKLKVMEFKLDPIDDDSWFEATQEFNELSGFPDPLPEFHSLLAELMTIDSVPFELKTRCDGLYHTRFGAYKVADEGLMLDLWSKFKLLSGNRELLSLIKQNLFMSSKTQKKKETKEVKKVVKELAHVAKEDKMVRGRSKAKGKRTQAAREFDGAYRVAKQSIPYGASAAKSMSRKFQASYIERQAYKYLVGLLNPTIPDMPGSPHGLPPGVQTMRWQVPIRGTVVANASGFAFVQLNADSWKADDSQYNPLLPDSGVRFLSFNGNTTPVVYSTAAYVGTTTPAPANGILPFPAGLAGDAPGGPGATVATIMPGANAAGLNLKYRFISGELAVQPITSALVQQGSLVAYRKIYVDEALAGLSFNNNTYDAIAGLPPSVAEVREQSIVEWPHGTWMRIPLIPSGSVGDYLLFPEQGVANRYTINDADVGFVLSGGAANQALRFEVTLNYESTVIPGFLASTYGNHPPIMVQEGEVPATSLLSMNDRKLIKQVDEAVGVDTDGAMAAMATHKALQEPAAANSSWLSDVVDGVGKVAPYVAEAASFIAALL